MLRVPNLAAEAPATESPFDFPLDPFQKHAIHAISNDENVLVTAKTGSGKTLVGEFQIWHSLKKGRRVFYTTPIKSLSNQKFHDLKKIYGDRVGIMTGDIKFCPQADIVIMTTEILRNLLFKQGTPTESVGVSASLSLEGLDAVVFDEVHYFNDPDRGMVWEECLTMLPPAVNLVLLSATIDQPAEFARWLGEIKQKPVHLISTEYRIVPLVHMTEGQHRVAVAHQRPRERLVLVVPRLDRALHGAEVPLQEGGRGARARARRC
jgi:antiviral helicase SKI2